MNIFYSFLSSMPAADPEQRPGHLSASVLYFGFAQTQAQSTYKIIPCEFTGQQQSPWCQHKPLLQNPAAPRICQALGRNGSCCCSAGINFTWRFALTCQQTNKEHQQPAREGVAHAVQQGPGGLFASVGDLGKGLQKETKTREDSDPLWCKCSKTAW